MRFAREFKANIAHGDYKPIDSIVLCALLRY